MKFRFDFARLGALMVKEGVQMRRDPSTFLIAGVLPMILLFLFGVALSLDSSHLRIAVVINDDSPAAMNLASAYQNSRDFDVTTARSVAEVQDRMIDGRVRGIIVIPDGFGAAMKRHKPIPIQIVADGSQPNVAIFVASYGEGVRAAWMAQQTAQGGVRATSPVNVSARFWYNPALKSAFMLVPGSIAIVMTMIGTLLTALVVAREWERGTMEAMMATPISMAEFIASKIIPYFLVALCSMALCTLVAIFGFGVPFRGSVLALLAISSCFLMPALGLGLFISSATKNQFVASQVALLSAFLPSFLLSGFMFEIGSMPKILQYITMIVPARYVIPSLQTVFLVGDVWGLFLPNMAMMVLFGTIFFLLSFRVSKRRIA